MKRAILLGSNGQVGTEIVRLWQAMPAVRDLELMGLTHADLEITDQQQLQSVLGELDPDIIINTAGFLRVDECESVPQQACLVNGIATKYLGEFAAAHGCLVVQFSTDYVFDGKKASPYTESDETAPLNAYGLSKLLGEHFLRYTLPERHLIVRTSGVFGVAGSTNKGGNFIETMLRLAKAGRDLSVVNDQTFSPTYAPDLARSVLQLIAAEARGTVHISNSDSTTWYNFARAAFEFEGLTPSLQPTDAATYGAAARRPRNSVLDNGRARELGAAPLQSWKDGLEAYLKARSS